MVKINWTKQSKNDLQDIFEFIAKDSKLLAHKEVSKIQKHAEVLKDFPDSGKRFEGLHDESLREIVYSHYKILYKIVTSEVINILTVHHGARSIPKRKLKY